MPSRDAAKDETVDLFEALEILFGKGAVPIDELNRRATHDGAVPPPRPPPANPLDGLEVTPEYERARSLVETGAPITLVSGRAGTGKSMFIHYLRHVLDARLAVVAPTGVAALNVQGATIHSFFRLPPHYLGPDDVRRVADRRLYSALDVLIIDEVSMVRADVVDAIDRFLRLNGRDETRPFGGVQLVLVGDLFQLPPVVGRGEQRLLVRDYPSPFFFSAAALQPLRLFDVELTKVYRQADAAFVALLDDLRVGRNVRGAVDVINRACAGRDVGASMVTLTCTNRSADAINTARSLALPGEPEIFEGAVVGRFPLDDVKLPSPRTLFLKPGAQVMFTKNDDQHRWVNGTFGRVVGFRGGSIQVELTGDAAGVVHDVQPVTWEYYGYEYDAVLDRVRPVVIGAYTQYPLMLAWAVTIHKGQGKTLEKACVDLGRGAFAHGQVYVALSRCRSLDDIALARPIAAREVHCDERILRFHEALAAAGAGDP